MFRGKGGRMKKATIKDVAARAGVSISVVSYVLNKTEGKKISESTIKRVKQAADELHYVASRFAGSMRTNKTNLIGVVMFWDIQSRVAMRLIRGINSGLLESGRHLVLLNVEDKDEFSYIKLFLDGSIDAVIFVSPFSIKKIIDENEHIEKMKENNIPFVIVNGSSEREDVSYVNIDVKKTAYTAAKYLIDKKFKDIIYVAPKLRENKEYFLRCAGYEQAADEAGICKREVCLSEFELKKGQCILANKTDTAHEIYLMADRLNLKPGIDFSVAAANTDSYSAYMIPPLTRVDTPMEAIGKCAAQKIADIIDKKEENREVLGEYKLTEGKSVVLKESR